MTNGDEFADAETQHGSATVAISGSPTQIVRIDGDVDIANAYDIDQRVSTAYRPEVDHVVVDLAGTTYLDSAGLAMLVRLCSRLGDARTKVTVVAPPDSAAHRVIVLSGLSAELRLRDETGPT
ncbi:MAG TPA: STAS domain-containing protein [Ilumatobacteraceae bacterium]